MHEREALDGDEEVRQSEDDESESHTNAEGGMRNAEWIERLSRREVVIRDRTCPSIPHSAFRIPHLSYLPIREQHTAARMALRVALVGHPEVGPADAIAAGHEPAEGVVEA